MRIIQFAFRNSKNHLKAIVEATVSGMEFVVNTYDNRFYNADVLASLRAVLIILSTHIVGVDSSRG